jgi:hypothetical protein
MNPRAGVPIQGPESRALEEETRSIRPEGGETAAVHTRQDVVLLVSLLTDLNHQIRSLKWTVFAVQLAVVLPLVKLW